MTEPNSVAPNPARILAFGKSRSRPRTKSSVDGADPKRIAVTFSRRVVAKSGWARSALNIVGAPMRRPAPRSIAASTEPASNRRWIHTSPPASSGASRFVPRVMWKNGEKNSSMSAGVRGFPCAQVFSQSHRLRWVWSTPFGVPVVPPVAKMMAGASSAGGMRVPPWL